ncbi:MAG: S8 family serine peptidase, partial [Alphaproteobacteria bacterium]|nr:S8 family serine peptidase [Alphaproteobacteria bacterium]
MYKQLAILLFILPLFLTACGGGGQGGSSAPTQQARQPNAQPNLPLQQRNTQLENTNRELRTQIENLNADINRQTQTGRTLLTDLTRLVSQIREQTGGTLPPIRTGTGGGDAGGGDAGGGDAGGGGAGAGGTGGNDIDALLRQTRQQLTDIETRIATLRTLAERINQQTGGNANLNNGINALIALNQQLQQQKDNLESEKRTLATQIARLQTQIRNLNAQFNPTPGNIGTPDPSRPYPYDTGLGTPSNLFAAHAALAANLRIYGRSFDPANLPLVTQETQANLAWEQGWTGKGVKIGHLDIFYRDKQPSSGFNPGALRHLSHGEIVRAVYLSIAPEVDYAQRQYNLFCGGNPAGQQEAAFEYFNANNYHIVQNSYGLNRYTYNIDTNCDPIAGTGRLRSDFDWDNIVTERANQALFNKYAAPAGTAGSFHRNMLFVWSAGNYGQGCTAGVGACTRTGGAILKLRSGADNTMGTADDVPTAGDRIIFVGALAAGTNNLAPYSQKAGSLQNDYLVAYDSVFSAGDVRGTSFAAPRVAGAAALIRHKFPNLDGPALKQVLLQTATDLGATGVDDVFGHGRLNIMNA